MSYILDSIKKAERERKLGQEAPTISIEYAGEHINQDNEVNWKQWMWVLSGLVLIAIIVWGVSNYFASRDQLYVQQIVNDQNTQVANKEIESSAVFSEKKSIEVIPSKKVHQSDLKTVKVITEEDKQYKPTTISSLVSDKPQKSIVAERHASSSKPVVENKQIKKTPNKSKLLFEQKPVVVQKNNPVAAKQDLVAIYSDLANSIPENQTEAIETIEPVTEKRIKLDEELVEIKPASYTTPEAKQENKQLSEKQVTPSHVVAKEALNTGLPSIGELPYDIQEKMPPFNVSVHMFHADPEQRRIRINGNMYTEGKQLQQDLALVEITRYGAVFDFQGKLFRLNVR